MGLRRTVCACAPGGSETFTGDMKDKNVLDRCNEAVLPTLRYKRLIIRHLIYWCKGCKAKSRRRLFTGMIAQNCRPYRASTRWSGHFATVSLYSHLGHG
jgi:hypothetical protein